MVEEVVKPGPRVPEEAPPVGIPPQFIETRKFIFAIPQPSRRPEFSHSNPNDEEEITLQEAVNRGLIAEIRPGQEPHEKIKIGKALTKKVVKPKKMVDRKAELRRTDTKELAQYIVGHVKWGFLTTLLLEKNELTILVGKYDEALKNNPEDENIITLKGIFTERLNKVERELLNLINNIIEVRTRTVKSEEELEDIHALQETMLAQLSLANSMAYRIGRMFTMSNGTFEGFEEEVKDARNKKKEAEDNLKQLAKDEADRIAKIFGISDSEVKGYKYKGLCGYMANQLSKMEEEEEKKSKGEVGAVEHKTMNEVRGVLKEIDKSVSDKKKQEFIDAWTNELESVVLGYMDLKIESGVLIGIANAAKSLLNLDFFGPKVERLGEELMLVEVFQNWEDDEKKAVERITGSLQRMKSAGIFDKVNEFKALLTTINFASRSLGEKIVHSIVSRDVCAFQKEALFYAQAMNKLQKFIKEIREGIKRVAERHVER